MAPQCTRYCARATKSKAVKSTVRLLVILLALPLIGTCGKGQATSDVAALHSDIARDETVVFFPTAGWFDAAAGEWHLPIAGWIYEPVVSTTRKTAFAQVLERRYDLTVSDENERNFSRRTNLLLADNERGKRIVIRLVGRNYELTESAANGHFRTTIVVAAGDAARFAEDGFLSFHAFTAATDTRRFQGSIQLVEPTGLSVISDIDDTVKISKVTDRRALLRHTFLLDFVVAPGMAELYRRWSGPDVAFHFVSSSPWQLYEPLHEFLDESNFPWATFSLKSIRFRDQTLLNLFADGMESKRPAIEAILNQYPEREFVLVGDSGEQDPEIYASLLREYPARYDAS